MSEKGGKFADKKVTAKLLSVWVDEFDFGLVGLVWVDFGSKADAPAIEANSNDEGGSGAGIIGGRSEISWFSAASEAIGVSGDSEDVGGDLGGDAAVGAAGGTACKAARGGTAGGAGGADTTGGGAAATGAVAAGNGAAWGGDAPPLTPLWPGLAGWSGPLLHPAWQQVQGPEFRPPPGRPPLLLVTLALITTRPCWSSIPPEKKTFWKCILKI